MGTRPLTNVHTMTAPQAALSLSDDVVAPGADLPTYAAGTFESEAHPTAVEWTRGLAVARGILPTLPRPFATVLEAALAAADDALAVRLARPHGGPDDGLVLFDADGRLTRSTLAAFLSGLDQLPSQIQGLEMKQRTHRHGRTVAVWLPGLGELQVEDRGAHGLASFGLFKSTTFLPHFEDGAPVHELPEQIWGRAICCGALCESNDGVASIRAVTHDGRPYAVTGGMFGSDCSEGVAWLLVPREDWVGPTFTYASMVAAFADGSRQRGDDRGLVVSVRGKQFVLSSFVRFVDRRAPEVRNAAIYGRHAPVEEAPSGLDDEATGSVHGLGREEERAAADQLALF